MLDTLLSRLVPEQTRRDFGMLWRGIRGDRPAPYTTPSRGDRPDGIEREASPEARAIEGRRLQIAEVRRETPNAVSIVFEDPFGEPIPFQAGQVFTITWPPRSRPGVTRFEKRAYSCSSTALDPTRVTITVKRVDGGVVSSDIHASAAVGEAVEVLGPSGNFTVPEGARELVLIGGGSGITPLMSIARTELASRGDVRIALVFGNRSEEEIIFADDLDALVREHAPRMRVRHALETVGGARQAAAGKLEESVLAAELDALAPGPSAIYFLCGPEPMMAGAERLLTARGVPRERIKIERFATLRRAGAAGRTEQEATVILNGARHAFRVRPAETLLEAGTRAGLDMPFSCTVGGCGACRVHLREGSVVMDEPNCLSDEEARAGYVLACVSRPTSAVVVEPE